MGIENFTITTKVSNQRRDYLLIILVIIIVALIRVAIDTTLSVLYYTKRDKVINAFLSEKKIECTVLNSSLKAIRKEIDNNWKLVQFSSDRYFLRGYEFIRIENCKIKPNAKVEVKNDNVH